MVEPADEVACKVTEPAPHLDPAVVLVICGLNTVTNTSLDILLVTPQLATSLK